MSKIFAFVLLIAPLASIFSWAAFDFVWWVEIGENDFFRGAVLFTLHIISIVLAFCVCALNSEDECEDPEIVELRHKAEVERLKAVARDYKQR